MESALTPANRESKPAESLGAQVRSAVIWRSGSQIVAQMLVWASTFVVIRVLDPRDYGLFAMTQVILVLLNMLNGYGLASALIQKPDVTLHEKRQLFGMLVLLNLVLGSVQFFAAPLAAAYYRQEMVAHLMRVQALMYLSTPFIAFAYALLSREMDFRKQGKVNFVSSLLGAGAAIGGALGGLGVWTLVLAPMVLFWSRAVGMTIAAKSLMWPSFDFRGAGTMAKYGGVMAAGQLFWFVQSQSDVFIAGRHFDPHHLGIYTTSLFLTQIFVSKFVPPLNEVAFSAYARMQHDEAAIARAFERAVRIIMVAALPFYFGLAATAEPLVLTVLGEKWRETIPVVHLLAFAMPFMTVQVLFSPACDARGRPGIGVWTGAIGAALLTIGYLIGVQWGAIGLTWVWIAVYPVYLAVTAHWAMPVIGTSTRALLDAVAPPALAAVGMALCVTLIDRLLPAMTPHPRLAILSVVGALVYGGWLYVFARGVLAEVVQVLRKQPPHAD
ncbi:lipopolysaccharide biosynthesis protein [soil metagenome]